MTLFSILARNVITTPRLLIGVGQFFPKIRTRHLWVYNRSSPRTSFNYSYIYVPIYIICVFLAHVIRLPIFRQNIRYVSRQRSRFRHVIRQSSNLHVLCALVKTSNLVFAIMYSETVGQHGFFLYAGRKIILFYYPFLSMPKVKDDDVSRMFRVLKRRRTRNVM